jgi:N-acetylneuraminic acid mutarotase
VYVFDPVTNSWSTKTALPEPRRRGAAAVMVAPDERTIYVSHGNNGGHETGNHAVSLPYLDAYDIGTDTWTALSDNAPHPRDHTGGAVLDNGRRLCVGGGRNGGELNWPDVAPTDCYDLLTGEWTVEASMPSPRAGSSYGVSCDGQYLLVAGGEGSGKAWNDVHAFDGQNWSKWASLNVGRHGSGLAVDCVCGNQIIIASGAAGQGGGPEITSVEIYFPNDEKQSCDA